MKLVHFSVFLIIFLLYVVPTLYAFEIHNLTLVAAAEPSICFEENICLVLESEGVTAESFIPQDYDLSSWKCGRCRRYNLERVRACAYCGKSR